MNFTKEDIRNAYIKLKSYVYYDNTDLLLRRQLVEFETSIGKDYLFKHPNSHYNINKGAYSYKIDFTIDEKFERIAYELNSFHTQKKFFECLIDKINIDFYPKKFKEEDNSNFISNERIKDSYKIERVTPFINAPIELHIISVLWIIRHGVSLDKKLREDCLGNRLLLNKDRTELVQGSGLFKPYFNQYQKWRDEAVKTAESILKKGKNVAFLNLDIKDYFSSVRIDRKELFEGRLAPRFDEYYNLKEIFLFIHDKYTTLLAKKYQTPSNFYEELIEKSDSLQKVVLPIGLVSSYVLANHYLQNFDESVSSLIKPAYYGRYVDDMLFVISDPNLDYISNKTDNSSKQNLEKFKDIKLSVLEKFVLQTFYPMIDLKTLENNKKQNENFFLIEGYSSLRCQSEKTLLHYFNAKESHLVIDRLKKELNEKTSEFRDFPEEAESNLSFTSSAYHLHYQGSEGKISTLKDYKENRFGLTIFLSNKIFSALRHENHLTDDECEEIVKFFKGETCLAYYRLWERILTLLLVNQKPKHYIDFFFHCLDEIDKIQYKVENSKLREEIIKNTLVNYLDTAHELSLSLNLDFLIKTKKESRNFEFRLNKIANSNWVFLVDRFEPTKPDSNWVRRFRESNMMRHHYVIHPLLTYSDASKKGILKDLTLIDINFENYKLNDTLLIESPRRVKFWECSMAIAFEKIGNVKNNQYDVDINNKVKSNLFSISYQNESSTSEFYLDDAYELFKKVNKNHIPDYELKDSEFRNNFYTRNCTNKNTQEIIVNKNKLKKFRIAFANTKVLEDNILASMRGTPNLSSTRYDQIANIVKKVRLDKSDVLLFPEFFIPINLLSSIVKYSEKNQVLTITGLEHVKIKDTVYNFIVTILPFEMNGVNDAVVVFRLKNHYAHIEESLIKGNYYKIANPIEYRYDIFNWSNLYFCPYYCFELADVVHRSLFKSKLDLLIGVEWNRDTNYFSNIVESCSRDLHCYIAQVNTSQFGDSRLTQPTESARLDILKLKGGENDSILVSEIDLDKLREFQRKTFDATHQQKEFKPIPPDFNVSDVLKRINNDSIL